MNVPADLPPGPRGHPVLGCLPEFGADPLGMLLASWEQYGDVLRLRGPVPKADLYLVAAPVHLDRVLSQRHLDYPHTPSFDARFGASGGNGIITVEGEQWVAQRAALEPVLGPERVAALVPTVARVAVEALRELLPAADTPVDLQQLVRGVSIRMLGTCLFADGWETHRDALTTGLETFVDHVGRKLSMPVNVPERLPTARNRRFLAARAHYDRAVAAIVARHDRAAAGADVLGGFVSAQASLGEQDDDRWVRNQLTNHFMAGHATVSAALAWTCHLLGTHPDVQQQVRDEARATLLSEVPTAAEVAGLHVTRAVLHEVLRLYPPLSVQPRAARVEDVLDGNRIPAGASVLVSSYLTHRHPEHWPEPEVFRPGRFADGVEGFRPGVYWPFSHGPRRCIGEDLAMVEMAVTLGLLLRDHRIVLRPRLPVQPHFGIGLEPAGGVPARLLPV